MEWMLTESFSAFFSSKPKQSKITDVKKKEVEKEEEDEESKKHSRSASPESPIKLKKQRGIVVSDESDGEAPEIPSEARNNGSGQSPAAGGIVGTTISGIEIKPGESIPYRALTNVFEKVEATPKRLEINQICTDFFLEVLRISPHELSKITYLFINRLGPDYEGLELGLGESLIIKSLSEATGRSVQQIRTDYHKVGDLGLVALKSRNNQPLMFTPKPLSVSEVFKNLTEIAKSSGTASQTKKSTIIKRMLTACKGSEPKYLIRSLEGKLRIGMAEKSVLTSLSQAFVNWEFERANEENNTKKKPRPEDIQKADEIVKDVYSQLPNYELIIDSILENGIYKLAESVKLTPGIPLKPMLAKPTKSITEILDRFHDEEFTCEYKYDGERAQVHCTAEGKISVYSRNMEDMSQRYPDIISIVPHFMKQQKSFILDCEAVAWDREQRKILPFQVLSTRKRKDVEEDSITVRVHLFAFDLLYLDGEVLLQKPLSERRKLIIETFSEIEGEFAYAKSMDSNNTEEIQQFLDQSVKDSCEGLMVKMLNGPESGYEPSKRSRNWLKLKKDYLSGVGDSLDLVVLGAYYGRGKRTNVYGGFLLGSYNTDSEEYETICKIGTGFSESNLEEFHKHLSSTVISEPKSYVSYDTAPSSLPDVWFEPTTVWEVLTADLSLSPIYKAGIQELGKGVSLRFPRFIRVRNDKSPEDATSSEQIVQFYQRQASLN